MTYGAVGLVCFAAGWIGRGVFQWRRFLTFRPHRGKL